MVLFLIPQQYKFINKMFGIFFAIGSKKIVNDAKDEINQKLLDLEEIKNINSHSRGSSHKKFSKIKNRKMLNCFTDIMKVDREILSLVSYIF